MSTHTPFTALPREIRDQVYVYVIGELNPGQPRRLRPGSLLCVRPNSIIDCPVLFVNHQLRQEYIEAFAHQCAKNRYTVALHLQEISHDSEAQFRRYGCNKIAARDRRGCLVSSTGWPHRDILKHIPHAFVTCAIWSPDPHWGATIVEDMGNLTKQFLASKFKNIEALKSLVLDIHINEKGALHDMDEITWWLESCRQLTSIPGLDEIAVEARHIGEGHGYMPPSPRIWLKEDGGTDQWKIGGDDKFGHRRYPRVECWQQVWRLTTALWRYQGSPTMLGARYRRPREIT